MIDKLAKIFTFLLVLMPIINQYASPIRQIGFGEILFMCLFPLMLVFMINKQLKVNAYLFFCVYILAITFLIILFQRAYSFDDVVFRVLREVFYIVLFLVFAQFYFDFNCAIKIYEKVVMGVCFYLIAQVIAFNLFGIVLPWYIKGLPLYIGTEVEYYMQHFMKMYTYFYRPTSVFLEPAMVAQYVLPMVIFKLFCKKANSKNSLIIAIFISVSLVLSTSGQSIVVLSLFWFIWFLKNIIYKRNLIYKIATLILITSIGFSVFYFYNTNDSFQLTLNRFNSIDTEGGVNSVNLRVLRGFSVYEKINLPFKIFGIGLGNLTAHLIEYEIMTPFDKEMGMEYMNSFSYILVSGGIIGISLFLWAMFDLFLKGTTYARYIIVLILVLSLMASIYSSPIWALYMCLILYAKKLSHDENSGHQDNLTKKLITEV